MIDKAMGGDKKPVSIITVVYNGSPFLEKTIKSVVDQTCGSVEYIVIDGGSTDGTVDILKKYENKIDYWVSEPDKGIYDAMNKGIEKANGSWILFLNAGDTFYENTALEKFNGLFSGDRPDLPDLVYGDVMMVYPDGNEQKRELKNTIPFLIRNMICHQCIFYSDRIFKQVGAFDTRYKLAADFEHFARVKWNNFKIAKIDAVISRYGLDGVSAQRNNIKKIWKERMQIMNEAGYMPALTRRLFWLYAKAAYEYRKIF